MRKKKHIYNLKDAEQGLKQARENLAELIKQVREMAGGGATLPARRLLMGGFSQGAMTALGKVVDRIASGQVPPGAAAGLALTTLTPLRKKNGRLRPVAAGEALRRLPPYATALGEVVGNGPGFNINLYGLPPASLAEVLLDTYFQPGKLPDSLADLTVGDVVTVPPTLTVPGGLLRRHRARRPDRARSPRGQMRIQRPR